MKHKHVGFTIVELLIIIVVVAVLAAISIVVYNGIQGRARDAQRIQDMKTIQKALELYKTTHGSYPAAISTPNASSWELSTNSSFLPALTVDAVSSVPVDPKNYYAGGNATKSTNDWVYTYYRYPATANGADPRCGHYYVLGVTRFDTVPKGQNHPEDPGFSTPGRAWSTVLAYATGRFENC